ncbi:hypothetical protein [Streptomyces sp. MK5]|uniref:hypothetical protein n=1 Tax=Streptomyces sp. MK5 TaxID=3064253 RepID=UPI002740759E|nr:hypothetical protein [Streptomyces sp. MK5]
MTATYGSTGDAAAEDRSHERTRVVTVDNKDSGDTIRLRRQVTDPIESVIAAMYEEFRRPRDPEDRLTCRRNGQDVFQFAALTLEEYLRQGHCPELHWAFVGGTGGA